MSAKLRIFNKVFNNILQRNARFLYFTRGVEFQKKAILELKTLLKRTLTLKKAMIIKRDEKLANTLLSLENLLTAYINELQMYVFLKEDNMSRAWAAFVDAQSALRSAFQADDIILKYGGESYLNKLELIEKVFFPHMTFNSIETKIQSSKCSICGSEYGTCDHVIGRPYMGQICNRIVTKMEYVGLAILIEKCPASKHCRITQMSDDDGNMRDALTWRIVSPIPKNDVQAKV